MLTIIHTAAGGTLLNGTARNDGTAEILKTLHWRYSRCLRIWYIPRSRDRAPQTTLINTTATRLRAAGHTVDLQITAGHRPTNEIEADRARHRTERAQALADRATRKEAAADRAEAHHQRLSDASPPLGQPILTDHHSAHWALRDLDRLQRAARNEITARTTADIARERANTAAVTDNDRYTPTTVARRIDTLEAEQRRITRQIEGHTRTLYNTPTGPVTETTPPATGDLAERLHTEAAALADQLEFWQGIRRQQLADGTAEGHSRETIAKADRVLYRSIWYEVIRANAKTVTVATEFGRHTIPYHQIAGHRPAR